MVTINPPPAHNEPRPHPKTLRPQETLLYRACRRGRLRGDARWVPTLKLGPHSQPVTIARSYFAGALGYQIRFLSLGGVGGVILGTVSCSASDLGLRLAHGFFLENDGLMMGLWLFIGDFRRSGLWDESCGEVLELDRMETWGFCRVQKFRGCEASVSGSEANFTLNPKPPNPKPPSANFHTLCPTHESPNPKS